MTSENLFLCMGSACHQMGVYEVLPKLQALLHQYQLDDTIVLKGSFCLDLCNQGITMKFRDRHFLNINAQNIEDKFVNEILPLIRTSASPCL
ncbi:MAG TPA: (2Fe-2S) ferredoxin domain-containing protein [Crinalium sp.]